MKHRNVRWGDTVVAIHFPVHGSLRYSVNGKSYCFPFIPLPSLFFFVSANLPVNRLVVSQTSGRTMAQVEVQTMPVSLAYDIKPIIRDKLRATSTTKSPVAFDPKTHLAYVEDPPTLSMKALGLGEDLGISPVAVSEPFALFTQEAIRIMRGEIFTDQVWDNCLHSTEFASCQLRGHCPK